MKDSRLLLVLGLLVAAFVLYAAVLTPLQTTVSTLQSELDAVTLEYTAGAAKIEENSQLAIEIENLKAEIRTASAGFYGINEQEYYLVKLKDMARVAGITFSSLAYSGTDTKIELTNVDPAAQTAQTLETTNANIPYGYEQKYSLDFTCTYREFLRFLNQLDSNEKHTVSATLKLQFTNEESDGPLIGSTRVVTIFVITEDMQGKYLQFDDIVMDDILSINMDVSFYYIAGLEGIGSDSDGTMEYDLYPMEKAGDLSPFKLAMANQTYIEMIIQEDDAFNRAVLDRVLEVLDADLVERLNPVAIEREPAKVLESVLRYLIETRSYSEIESMLNTAISEVLGIMVQEYDGES